MLAQQTSANPAAPSPQIVCPLTKSLSGVLESQWDWVSSQQRSPRQM
jgi:hypothetical protein